MIMHVGTVYRYMKMKDWPFQPNYDDPQNVRYMRECCLVKHKTLNLVYHFTLRKSEGPN